MRLLKFTDGEISDTFPTPMLYVRWSQATSYLKDIEEICRHERTADSLGTKTSNIGGWRSAETFLQRADESIVALRNWIEETAHGMVVKLDNHPSVSLDVKAFGWVNINGPNDYKQVHVHANFAWAANFMVTRGEPSDEMDGAIVFIDPRMGASMVAHTSSPFFSPRAIFQQEPGTLLVFPAWLLHAVNPSSAERISIGIDLAVRETEAR